MSWPPIRSNWLTDCWYSAAGYLPDRTTGEELLYGREPSLTVPYTHADFAALGSAGSPATVTIGFNGISSSIGSLAGIPSGRFSIVGLQVILDGIEVVGNINFQGFQTALLGDQDLSALAGHKLQVRNTTGIPVPGSGSYPVCIGPPDTRQILTYTGIGGSSTTASGAQTLTDGGTLVLASAAGLDAAGKVGVTATPPATTAVGVNALNSATVNVASTHGYPAAGTFKLTVGGVTKNVSYTGVTPTSFTGCNNHSATVGGEAVTSAALTNEVLAYTSIVGNTLQGISGLDSQTIAAGAPVKQLYLTGCSVGPAGTVADGSDVNVNLDVTNAQNYIAVEPNADGFTEWETTLGATVDLNHLPDGAGGYVKAATLTTPDGKVKFTARNWGTSPQNVKIVIAAGGGGGETVNTTGTNYSLDRTVTVTMRAGGSTAAQIAAAIAASGNDPAKKLITATDLGLGGTVAAMATTALAGGVDGVLTLPSVSGLPAAGQIDVQAGFAFSYDSIDVPSKTLHGVRYVYCGSGVSSYLWPDTIDLGGPSWTCGSNTPVAKLLPAVYNPASNEGLISYHQCTGDTRNVLSRHPSGDGFQVNGCTNLAVERFVVYQVGVGNLGNMGGGNRNVVFKNGTMWTNPGCVTGAVAAHYDGFDISSTYNDDGVTFESVFFPVSKGNGNVTFCNNPAPARGAVFHRCLFGLVEPRGAQNAFDLHTCDTCGARDCRWDRSACLDPSGATLTDAVDAPFGTTPSTTNIVNPSPDPAAVLQADGTYTITKIPGTDVPDAAAFNCNLWDDGTIVAGGGGGRTKFSALESPPAPIGGTAFDPASYGPKVPAGDTLADLETAGTSFLKWWG